MVSPDNQSVDCPKAGISAVLLNLGAGDDVAAVSANVTLPVIFDGGSGNDGLFGGGGTDVFSGGSGDDNIIARDGRGEQVDCGSGNDTAISDDADTPQLVRGDRGRRRRRRRPPPADCNDANPGIRPGAADTPDDGVDQDCSGTDASNLDRDGDGSPRPQDCNDADAAIRPGAREIVGNSVDENCDTAVVPFPALQGLVGNLWQGVGLAHRELEADRQGLPEGHADRAALLRPGLPVAERHEARAQEQVDREPPLVPRLAAARPRRARRAALHALRARRPCPPLPDGPPRRAERRLPVPAARRPDPGLLARRRSLSYHRSWKRGRTATTHRSSGSEPPRERVGGAGEVLDRLLRRGAVELLEEEPDAALAERLEGATGRPRVGQPVGVEQDAAGGEGGMADLEVGDLRGDAERMPRLAGARAARRRSARPAADGRPTPT